MDRLTYLRQLLGESPQDTFIIYALAKEYEGRGDDDQALTYYQQLLTLDPDYVGAYYHLGKLQEKLDQAVTAFATYSKGMETAHKLGDQHAYSELAGARLQLGDEDDFSGL